MTDSQTTEPQEFLEQAGIPTEGYDLPERLLTEAQVEKLTGWSRSGVRRHWIRGDFPTPIKLSHAPNGSTRWKLSEIMLWLSGRPRADIPPKYRDFLERSGKPRKVWTPDGIVEAEGNKAA